MKIRWGCFALCLLLCLPYCGLAQPETSFVMAGYDPEEIARNWSTNQFFVRMEKNTGIHFTFRQYGNKEKWTEIKTQMSSSGDVPDALFKAELTPAETMRMVEQGVLIDLKPLLPQYAPNLWTILQKHPEYMEQITLPEGQIVALPFINTAPLQNCVWINARWLKELKLDMPKDLIQLEDVLEAFKTRDPNRNGKSDEVPFTFLGAYDLKYMAHAFGLVANDFNIFDKDGKVCFMPLEEEFRPFIQWCRAMHEKGLLDPDGFTTADALRKVADKNKPQLYGVLMAPLPSHLLPVEWVDDYRVMPPLEYKDRVVYRTAAPSVTTGCFAITSACAAPEKLLRWVDTLYTEAGAVLAAEGLEGEDYLVDGDGTWRKTATAENNAFLSDVAITTGGVTPGISAERFENLFYDVRVARMAEQIGLVGSVAVTPFPPYMLTHEQEAYIVPLQNAIGRYVDESIARWVTGEWAVNEEQFILFEKGLNDRGLSEFMSFWQAVLDQRTEVRQ